MRRPLTARLRGPEYAAMRRRFFHADLDAFFASVEQLDNPDLRGKPVIVGALPGGRGVVSTCSYEARKFGLHSAMPIARAFALCPKGVFLPVRMRRYAEMSRKVMDIFSGFTPDVERLSIDEARLDLTGTQRLWGEDEACALKLKAKVREETGLTVSIGASSSRYAAKVASGLRKPDGLFVVPQGREAEFMRSLPLERLWGAGEKTRALLKAAGISSIAGIQDAPMRSLESILGKAGAAFIFSASMGRDAEGSDTPGSRSMSAERTFQHDCSDKEKVEDLLRLLADELSARLWAENERSRTVVLKLRFSDFETITRQTKCDTMLASSDAIFEVSLKLLHDSWDSSRPLRLVGLGLHDLGDPLAQGGLFDGETPRSEEALRLSRELERRGKGKLMRARHLPGPRESPGE